MSHSASNPYILDRPITKSSDFFGQEEILEQCWEVGERTRYYSISGGPGSGKTSLLNRLQSRDAQHRSHPSVGNLLFIYLDCRLVPSAEAFMQQVARLLIAQLPRSLADDSGCKASGDMDDREFQDLMESLPKKPVLLMDNIDAITTHPGFSMDFFRYMRGLAIDPGVSMITTSCQLLKDCFPPDPVCSDFWNIFTPVSLPPFTEEAMIALLTEQGQRSGLSLLPYREEIEKLAGRIPFFVQLASWHYFEALRDHAALLSPAEREQVQRQVAHNVTPKLQRIWENLSTEEKKAARKIAQDGQVSGENATIASLRKKGYICRDGLFSPLFTEYILNTGL